jgi:hypothetical protein
MCDLGPTIELNTKVTLQEMSRKIKLKRKKKLHEFLPNFLSVFLFVVGANFSEARVRRNFYPVGSRSDSFGASPQPFPSRPARAFSLAREARQSVPFKKGLRIFKHWCAGEVSYAFASDYSFSRLKNPSPKLLVLIFYTRMLYLNRF